MTIEMRPVTKEDRKFWFSLDEQLSESKERLQGKGVGKYVMLYWEKEMKKIGYKLMMTSTQINEEAQHFYRKLGYVDKGAIFFDGTGYEQPQEVVMMKVL